MRDKLTVLLCLLILASVAVSCATSQTQAISPLAVESGHDAQVTDSHADGEVHDESHEDDHGHGEFSWEKVKHLPKQHQRTYTWILFGVILFSGVIAYLSKKKIPYWIVLLSAIILALYAVTEVSNGQMANPGVQIYPLIFVAFAAVSIIALAIWPDEGEYLVVVGALFMLYLQSLERGSVVEAAAGVVMANLEGIQLGMFLAGLFLMVTAIARLGLFIAVAQYAVNRARKSKHRAGRLLFLYIAALASLLTAFADEATAISALRLIAEEISKGNQGFGLETFVFVLQTAVKFGNYMSFTTPIANPASIMAAIMLGVGIIDFAMVMWPVAILGFGIGVSFSKYRNSGEIVLLGHESHTFDAEPTLHRRVWFGAVCFGIFIVGMMTHTWTEPALGLAHNTIFMWLPWGVGIFATIFGPIAIWINSEQVYSQPYMRSFVNEYFLHELPGALKIFCITVILAVMNTSGGMEYLSELLKGALPSYYVYRILVLVGMGIVVTTVATNFLDNVVAVILVLGLFKSLNLDPGLQFDLGMLVTASATVTSSFVYIGSIGGIVVNHILAKTTDARALKPFEWSKIFTDWTFITSFFTLGILASKVLLKYIAAPMILVEYPNSGILMTIAWGTFLAVCMLIGGLLVARYLNTGTQEEQFESREKAIEWLKEKGLRYRPVFTKQPEKEEEQPSQVQGVPA